MVLKASKTHKMHWKPSLDKIALLIGEKSVFCNAFFRVFKEIFEIESLCKNAFQIVTLEDFFVRVWKLQWFTFI